MRGRGFRLLGLLFVISLVAAACGDGEGQGTGATGEEGAAGNGPVELIPASAETRGPRGEEPVSTEDLQLSDEDIAALEDKGELSAVILWPASFQFYQVASAGIRSELDKVGGRVLSQVDSGYDAAQQATDLESALALNPDMIFTWLVDPVTGAEAFRPAVERGIQLSFMSNLPEGFEHPDDYTAVVTDDLFGMGEAAAEMMAEALGEEGKIGWIFHDADAYVTNQRDQAFKQVIEERYPNIEIVAEGGFAEPEGAFDIANSMILQHPDIEGIYAPWAVPAANAVEALRAAERPDVKVVTLDLDPTVAIDMAQGGNIVGIVADVPFEIGRGMAVSALWGLIGKEAPPFSIVPTMKVTRDNLITAWRESLKEDPPPEVIEALG